MCNKPWCTCEGAEQAIEAARSEGYRAGLEEAAKECESIATGAAMVDARFDSDFAAQVAAAIRALMGKEGE
jgi:flagellar biosynthesis/type III secretory pathway protein FliH